MTEANPSESSDQGEPYATPADTKGQEQRTKTPRSRTPRKMLITTGVVVSMIVLAFVFISTLDDLFGIGLDVVMVASMAGTALLILLWMGWFLMFSRWKWWQRIVATISIAAMPFLFMVIFRPVNGGDANIVRFEFFWNSNRESPKADVEIVSTAVDLTVETPDDYPRFLGAQQNSIVAEGPEVDAARFSESKVLWKQPIGRGWSGFATRNGFAVTLEQREDQECVTCYSIDSGDLRWLYKHKARHQDQMNMGRVGPRSTPTIHDGKVFAMGALGNLVCLHGNDGSVVWQTDLNELLGISLIEQEGSDGKKFQLEKDSALAWGRSGSPLIVDDLVVVPGGGPLGGKLKTLLAFDIHTGELRWHGGKKMIAYGSPVLATVANVPQILLIAEADVMSFDPATGNVLWTFPRPGETNGGANTAQVTIVSSNQVLSSKGYPDGGGELIELSNSDGKLVPMSIWKNQIALKTKLMSPIVHKGHSYSLSNGFLECVRLSDGRRVWKHRGRFGHGQMVLLKDKIVLHSESGVLHLINATSDGYEELGSVPTISGVCWNTLGVYGDKVLVRSELEAACVQLAVK